jgi:hypothetical protein
MAYKTTVLPLHYTGELAPGARFERAHSLLNRQMPCHLATPEYWWARAESNRRISRLRAWRRPVLAADPKNFGRVGR